MQTRSVLGAASALCALALTAPSDAATREIAPGADLAAEIAALSPGDELVLAGGTYTLGSRLSIGVSGTAAAPIVIRAKAGETPIITRDASQNTINVENTQYVVLRGLEVTGGSHGIRINDSDFITVEECHVHDTADVAISANIGGASYEGLQILRNHIHDTGGTGEGMYLGCNNGGCVMFNSLIEGNYVHHTNAADVTQGDGIEIKQGSYGNTVRDNVIHDTGYPCILVYGSGGGAVNLIERNAMWACGDHGIQAEADAIIENNLVLGAAANGIHSQNHQQGGPGNLQIVHNTILVNNTAIRINAPVASILLANNAVYSSGANALQIAGDTGLYTISGNVGTGTAAGVTAGYDNGGNRASDFVDAANLDVFPAAGSSLLGAADPSHEATDDFNGTARSALTTGAYEYAATGNPGWQVGEGFKDPTAGGGSGGTGGSAGAGTGGSATGGSSGSGTGGGATGGTGGAGTGGSATGGNATGGTATGGSAASSAGAASSDDSGCGCALPGSAPRGAAWLSVLGAVWWLGGRRRRAAARRAVAP